ncbi:unnamed protein product [Prorocentrum cordatum]|uniref:Pentacotripeptide-repeat region of PRORP domain-containing protein n=1 Tax=Prorocentrum cordatum TaxID=2364126 RepID=A0ABN9WK82_9DINO|nr:unnamed protein product [Polarella glacialis]
MQQESCRAANSMPFARDPDVQIGVLMSLLVAVYALSKVTQDEGTVELWIVLMPMLTYAIGCANARKHRAGARLRFASEVREGSTPESALRAFEEMVEQGQAPDDAAFNRALRACARLGQVDRALQVRGQMPLFGCVPDRRANAAMIRACTAAGRVGEALDIFEECAQPSPCACRDPIRCYIEAERLGKAVTLYKEMAESDMPPCAKTFQRLSSAAQEQGWMETAAELLGVHASWVNRIEAVASDVLDASSELGDTDSE